MEHYMLSNVFPGRVIIANGRPGLAQWILETNETFFDFPSSLTDQMYLPL